MKKCFSFLVLMGLVINHGLAHEGGHGEIEESGKFGGRTAPVVDNREADNINAAKVLYKAELVRSESGKLSLYLFNNDMQLLPLDQFENDVMVKLEVKKSGKYKHFGELKMSKDGNHFMGQLPAVEYKPFNLDMYLMSNQQKLFVGFANLD